MDWLPLRKPGKTDGIIHVHSCCRMLWPSRFVPLVAATDRHLGVEQVD
jgi:hypothetical protein